MGADMIQPIFFAKRVMTPAIGPGAAASAVRRPSLSFFFSPSSCLWVVSGLVRNRHWHRRPRDQITEKFLGASPMTNRKVFFESSPISYAILGQELDPISSGAWHK
jgi:hypothetical protein